MRRQWLSRSQSANLTLIFGGWALGAGPFACLTGEEDALFVDDFRNLDDPLPELAQYDRVSLVAFSFGVASAAHWMSRTGFQPATAVAVSGTLTPADTETGIPPDRVRATADTLSNDSFGRFCRRAGLDGPPPSIDIAAARNELHAIVQRGPAPPRKFDLIWIPNHDRIIPTKAQEAAWHSQHQTIRHIPGPHIPFRPGQSWAAWTT